MTRLARVLAPLLWPAALAAQRDSARAGGILEPIAVRAAADTGSTPLSRSSLGPQDLRLARAAAGFLDEALARVPGLTASSRGTFALDTRLTVRGAGARSAFGVRGVTVLLDGVPQTLPDGQANLSQVDPAALDRVEIVRGAAAAFYGNAAGGVISLSSEPVLGAGAGARIRFTGGSYGLFSGSAVLRTVLGSGAAGLTLSQTSLDGYRAYSSGLLRQASGSLQWPFGPTLRAGARLRVSQLGRAENPGALTATELAADPRGAAPRNLAFHAGKHATEWQASADAARTTGVSDVSAVLFGIWRDLDNPLPSSWVRLERADLGARLSGRWQLTRISGGPELLAGLDLQRQQDERRNFDNDSGRIGDAPRLDQRETVTSLGARGAMRVPLAASTEMLAGLRADHVVFVVRDRLLSDGDGSGRRAMGALSFTVALQHRGGPMRARASLGSAFESPTTTELARPGTGGFNLDLKPQRSLQAEAGLGYRSGRLSLELTGFRTTVREALVPREEPTSPGRFYFVNAGRVRLRGLEAELSLRLSSWLDVALSGTLTDHRYASFPTDSTPLDGRLVPGLPRRGWYLLLGAGGAAAARAELELVHAGRAWADDVNSASAPPWTIVNLRTARRGRIAPFGGVRNLLAEPYVGSLNVNGAARRFFEPAPERTWYLGVETRIGP